jgi:hypothetical protein
MKIRKWRERMWWHSPNNYLAFRLGYITALDDVDRTGLRPSSDEAKSEAAKRAAERLYNR